MQNNTSFVSKRGFSFGASCFLPSRVYLGFSLGKKANLCAYPVGLKHWGVVRIQLPRRRTCIMYAPIALHARAVALYCMTYVRMYDPRPPCMPRTRTPLLRLAHARCIARSSGFVWHCVPYLGSYIIITRWQDLVVYVEHHARAVLCCMKA